MRSFMAHFERESDCVEQADGSLIFAAFEVRIAVAANGEIVHGRNLDEMRSFRGKVKFFVFFLKIEGHGFSIAYGGCNFDMDF